MRQQQRQLTGEELSHGYRCGPNGVHGTPRSDKRDPRFDKSGAPRDAFTPNAAAVWAVLDRLTWLTLADARHLTRVDRKLRGDSIRWDHHDDPHQCHTAARSAGRRRFADWQSIEQIVHHTKMVTAPPEAGRRSGQYSDATCMWDEAFALGRHTAEALLVADRRELTDAAYDWLTCTWMTVFGDDFRRVRTLRRFAPGSVAA